MQSDAQKSSSQTLPTQQQEKQSVKEESLVPVDPKKVQVRKGASGCGTNLDDDDDDDDDDDNGGVGHVPKKKKKKKKKKRKKETLEDSDGDACQLHDSIQHRELSKLDSPESARKKH